MRSTYTLNDRPPLAPPLGVSEITAWQLAAALWHQHVPVDRLSPACFSCGGEWPCESWQVADDLLADACQAATPPVQPNVRPMRASSEPAVGNRGATLVGPAGNHEVHNALAYVYADHHG